MALLDAPVRVFVGVAAQSLLLEPVLKLHADQETVSDDVEPEREERSVATAAAELLHFDVLRGGALLAGVLRLFVVTLVATVFLTVFVTGVFRFGLMKG